MARQASSFQKSKTLNDKYLLGDEIGKGAYGRVYKGLDQHNGDFVAIKQVSLDNIADEDLATIMQEIDLLKNLNHRNIVKYLGSFKTKSHLYIILEFVENGSLASIIKPNKFGAFPESLVAIYIAQVLEGLVYLHEQGVIHRDIKGANILTTKEGLVKLADFGVATKLNEQNFFTTPSVVGTPYWMAPEVIEMSGVSAASDIWSVGCTVIELLTCSPPYYDLQPMPALFRIVQDDIPPIPDHLSPAITDFLHLCFHKDAKLRPDAKTLLNHPWIMNTRKVLHHSLTKGKKITNIPENVSNVLEKTMENSYFDDNENIESPIPTAFPLGFENDNENNININSQSQNQNERRRSYRNSSSDLNKMYKENSEMKKPSSPSPSPLSPSASSYELQVQMQMQIGRALSMSPLNAKKKHDAVNEERERNGQTNEENNENDDESESNYQANEKERNKISLMDDNWDRSSLNDAGSEFSDFSFKYSRQDSRTSFTSMKRNQVKKLERFRDSNFDKNLEDLFSHSPQISQEPKEEISEQFSQESFSEASVSTVPVKRNLSAHLKAKIKEKEKENVRLNDGNMNISFDMNDDNDIENLEVRPLNHQINTIQTTEIPRIMNDITNVKSVDAVISSCNKLIEIFHENYEQKRIFSSYYGIAPLIDILASENPKIIFSILTVINELVNDNAEVLENFCIIGLIPITISFFTRYSSFQDVILQCSFVIRSIFTNSTLTLQMFLSCDGFSIVPKLLNFEYTKNRDIIHVAIDFMCKIFELNVSLFKNDFYRLFSKNDVIFPLINTMHKLCEFLINSVSKLRDVSIQNRTQLEISSTNPFISLQKIDEHPHVDESFLKNTSAGKKFSQKFENSNSESNKERKNQIVEIPNLSLRNGDTLSPNLSQTLEVEQEIYLTRGINLLLEISNGDDVVKSKFCQLNTLKQFFELFHKLNPPVLLQALKCLKQLSMDPNCLENLQKADAIKKLIPFLESTKGPLITQIHTEVLSTLYNLCKINKRRQELSAEGGIAPHLMRLVEVNSPLKQFALPLLCDMAHASRATRDALLAAGALELYLTLLREEFWAPTALDSLAVCLSYDSHDRVVENGLLRRESVRRLVDFFASCSGPAFAHILEPFLKMITKSTRLNVALSTSGFSFLLISRLDNQDAISRLTLLKMIKIVYEHHPNPKQLIVEYHLPRKLQLLMEERRDGERTGGQVLVKQMASVLLKGLHINTVI